MQQNDTNAADDDAQTETNIDEAEAKLEEIRGDLDALRANPIVSGHGAEDYIEEAISSLEAATVDVADARSELIDDTHDEPIERIEIGDVLQFYEDTPKAQRWVVTAMDETWVDLLALECESPHISKGEPDRCTRAVFNEVFGSHDVTIEDREVSD